MSRISPEFAVREVPGGLREGRQLVRLLEPVEYDGDDGLRVVVPVGFVTDFASVPTWLDGVVPSFGPWARAAIVHDWLYHQRGDVPGGPVSRKAADAVFKDALKLCGVPSWRREAMWLAARVGGASGWGRGGEPH